MPTVHLSPIGNDAAFYANGVQLSGGQLYTYLAGTTTTATTYTSSAGVTTNANPIVLNSEGYPAIGGVRTQIWLTTATSYKFVLRDSNGVILWTMDNIDGINDINLVSSEWVSTAPGVTVSFVNSANFTFSGDQTNEALPNRWIKTVNTLGTTYSIITAAAFSSGITSVQVANASGVLDSGLSSLQYGVLRPDHPSVPMDATHLKATAVVAAATTSIWNTNGNYVHITGATGVTSFIDPLFPPRPGSRRRLVFDTGLTITHNGATLICPGAANFTAVANDIVDVVAESTTSVRLAPFGIGLPAGVIADYAGASVPAGWLECDGSSQERVVYASLFAAIGTTWGSADSTHFTLPDFRGRVRMGKGTGGYSLTLTNVTPAANAIVVASNVDRWITGMAITVSGSVGFTGTGLVDGTHYVIRVDDTHIKFASTLLNAQIGTAETTTGGPGSAVLGFTFNARTLALSGGQEQHLISSTELPAHVHSIATRLNTSAGTFISRTGSVASDSTQDTESTGGTVSMNITQPYAVTMVIIKL